MYDSLWCNLAQYNRSLRLTLKFDGLSTVTTNSPSNVKLSLLYLRSKVIIELDSLHMRGIDLKIRV